MSDRSKILVVGSIAYDNVMKFSGHFKDAIVPDNYNIALNASDREISYGGCGANMAYTLKMLDEEPVLLTSVGKDFDNYKERFDELGISMAYLFISEDLLTASAFIVTDDDENQITLFEPGAIKAENTGLSVKKLSKDDIVLAIISPDNTERMAEFAYECKELGIPYIFDPGQVTPIFDLNELEKALQNASILIVNKYESELLSQRLSKSKEELKDMVPIYIETNGPNGIEVKEGDKEFYVKAVKPGVLVDPTGSGDAFRAGLLMGLKKGLSLQISCQIGALAGSYAVEKKGTQEHSFT
ncbi:carbohydrate kinase family protein, partial [Pseudomonadota bacterium]